MKKTNTIKVSFLSYFLITTVVVMVFLAVYYTTGAFFQNIQNITGQITLGDIDFQILSNLSTVVTAESNYYVPGEIINNSIEVLNARDEQGQDYVNLGSVFIRIQPFLQLDGVDSNEYLYIELNNASAWTQGTDGFLYYNNYILGGESVIFNNYFELSYLLSNSYQNKPVFLKIQVDAIQSSKDAYLDIWNTAPSEWINIVNNLT